MQFLLGLFLIVARKPLTPHFYVGVATPTVRFSAASPSVLVSVAWLYMYWLLAARTFALYFVYVT